MLIKLTGGNKSLYGQSTQKLDHNICDTGLFTDNNLVRALDMHPPEHLNIYTVEAFQVCDRGITTSRELLEAVKRGAICLNLCGLHELSTPHGRLVNHMHTAFSRHMGVRMHSRSASLMISPPKANVSYDFAVKDAALWQIRGRKRLVIYPNTPPFIQPQNIQKVVLDGYWEKPTYSPEFESRSINLELRPGELICWPHFAPKRVENIEGLNVCLNLESLTLASRARLGAHYFDGYMNNRFDKHLLTRPDKRKTILTKALLAALIKKSKAEDLETTLPEPAFKVDMGDINCLKPL